jgi:DNA repair protein RecN (Recombination protein N)|tara:strand:- start:357 stop:2063 length:1707 start_codon:yes stop_codon:yes gene_type:complete
MCTFAKCSFVHKTNDTDNMLSLLKIKNLALVDQLSWQLGTGLVGVTGETGAGKSVIVGALKLILGERADKGLIRTGESACTIEAVFTISADSLVNDILEESGLDRCEDDQLIIKRIIGHSNNKQFVNNSPATLTVLKKIGTEIVDLHGPHDHQSLLSTDRQLSMLDAYANSEDTLAAYRQIWSEWHEKSRRLEDLRNSERATEQELDLLKFQVDEIDSADLKPDEEEDIELQFKRVSNSSKLIELSSKIAGTLEHTVNDALGETLRAAKELQALDPSVADRLTGLEQAVLELQDLEREMTSYSEGLDIDPEEEHQLSNRINTFETLKRKYGATLTDIITHGDDARHRLMEIENRDGVLDDLQLEVDGLFDKVLTAAQKLTSIRKKSAPKLAKVIALHLKELGFKQAAFELSIIPQTKPAATGMESIDFQFGPNPGEPLKPLRQIASSGEISRVMLAVKSSLADQDATPLMVFDEIDANVGGEIARAVGDKMATLGEQHQVIAITHFPQVAAVAGQHFVVEKQVDAGRTTSSLREVTGKNRIDELVRMLGGGDGKQAIAMAKSLLKNNP